MKPHQPARSSEKQSNHLAIQSNSDWTRRKFLLRSVAAWATVSVVPRHVLGGVGHVSPNQQPNLAGVGVGGVGFGQLKNCDHVGFKIAALCDVDDQYAKRAFDHWPQARRYRDYREMLAAEGDKIDAVYCGTPDHTHALITLAALKQGKHVCCVKPLTRTIDEARIIAKATRAAKVATQMTASANSTEPGCRTCELIWAGAIGNVREVHIWSNRPLWPQGMQRPLGEEKVPDHLDWKMWLGPAPIRPFVAEWPDGHLALQQLNNRPRRAVYHPWNFRGWWDFGTGALGDMGCHHLNKPFRALKLTSPVSVHATSTKVLPESAPLSSIVTWDFPARTDMPPVRLIWYDGGVKPPRPKELHPDQALPNEGTLYIGDEGKMLGTRILPKSRDQKYSNVPRTLPRRSGTWGEWFEACTGGPTAACDFAWSVPLTETVLLGNIAIRTRKFLEWDAAKMKVTNEPKANNLLKEPYHNGWRLEV